MSPKLLPPTVVERITQCSKAVTVAGSLPGALVRVVVEPKQPGDGPKQQLAATATGNSYTFGGLELPAGASIRASQELGADPSAWSAPVVVESVEIPLAVAPVLPVEVEACSGCVAVKSMVPGCTVQVYAENGPLLGTASAASNGAACVGLSWLAARAAPSRILARMVAGPWAGPWANAKVQPAKPLGAPRVAAPLACGTAVFVEDLRPGAGFEVEVKGSAVEHVGCVCITSLGVGLSKPLLRTDLVRARLVRSPNGSCAAETGPWSAWATVAEPSPIDVQPKLPAVLWAGAKMVEVQGQREGAELFILVGSKPDDPSPEVYWRPASVSPMVDLGFQLQAGTYVAARQAFGAPCSVEATSYPWVQVQKHPASVPPPTVLPPLFDCGGAVVVTGMYPGATARLYQNGHSIGKVDAALAAGVVVECAPVLHVGGEVTALQEVGSVQSELSWPVIVGSLAALPRPRLLRPPTVGDSEVVVSAVLPGARIIVWQGSDVIGDGFASDSAARIGLARPVGEGPVRLTERLCDLEAVSDPVSPTESVEAPGEFQVKEPIDLLVNLPIDDPKWKSEQSSSSLWLPQGAPSPEEKWPLAIFVHGLPPVLKWSQDPVKDMGGYLDDVSYTGYDYVASHLASWGIAAVSVNVRGINGLDAKGDYEARVEMIGMVVAKLKEMQGQKDLLDFDRVCLIGHSMGGKAVVIAAGKSVELGLGTAPVRGVVSIAPTDWGGTALLPNVKTPSEYLHVLGSRDHLIAGKGRWSDCGLITQAELLGGADGFNSLRLYDEMPRPKSQAWVPGADHWAFNTAWDNVLNDTDPRPPNAQLQGWMDPEKQRRALRTLLTAFCRWVLQYRTEYRSYFDGLGAPTSLRQRAVSFQRHEGGVKVVDAFEGGDTGKNDLGGFALGGGSGEPVVATVEHLGLLPPEPSATPFELDSLAATRTLKLAWKASGGALYATGSPAGEAAFETPAELSFRYAGAVTEDALPPLLASGEAILAVLTEKGWGLLRAGALVPPPTRNCVDMAVFATCRLPWDAFFAGSPDANAPGIVLVWLLSPSSPEGGLYVDDIELVP